MKKLSLTKILSAFLIAVGICAAVSCSSWTDVAHSEFDAAFRAETPEFYEQVKFTKDSIAKAEADSLAKAEAEKWKHLESWFAGFPYPKDEQGKERKLTFGWFGSWTGVQGGQGSLCSLPEKFDCVSLWGYFNLTAAQQKDLALFQARGSKAWYCWRAGEIGTNVPHPTGGEWGDTEEDARLYARCIADNCRKYGVNGFDYDLEDGGSLGTTIKNQMAFFDELRYQFDLDIAKGESRYLCVDIPSITQGWDGYFFPIIENKDVALNKIDLFIFQCYDYSKNIGSVGTPQQYENAVKQKCMSKGYTEDEAMKIVKKSLMTGTFEEDERREAFINQVKAGYNTNLRGFGAYHVEFDFGYNPDTPYADVNEAMAFLKQKSEGN